MARWAHALLASLLLAAGCSATLKERNNELEEQLEDLEARSHLQVERILELEHEIDACMDAVDRKAATEVLAAAGVNPTRPLFATLHTSKGAIRIQLFPDLAPRTVANFVSLAEGTQAWTDPLSGEVREDTPLYDGVLFHRVLPEYVIQTGDPMGTGTGGSGHRIPDEFSEDLRHDRPGVVSMANSGPDTGESQFFVTLAAAPQLDGKHSAFGRVVQGMDVVEAISRVPTGAVRTERPNDDVVLQRVEIVRE